MNLPNNDLELDLSIIHEPEESGISLSDHFGFPVFREDNDAIIRDNALWQASFLDFVQEGVFLLDRYDSNNALSARAIWDLETNTLRFLDINAGIVIDLYKDPIGGERCPQ